MFCVKDTKPREFSKTDEEILEALAGWAELEINARNLHIALEARKNAERELRERLEELKRLNDVMVGREIKMIELKEEIEKLKEELRHLRTQMAGGGGITVRPCCERSSALRVAHVRDTLIMHREPVGTYELPWVQVYPW
ncbi:MAG: hypothetical protein Q7R85_01245 [bacterium]|nr:hypothetical protein [bacterium]